MPITKASELRELTADDLYERLDDAKEELFNLRFQQKVGQLEDTSRPNVVKREIARIYTVLRERELEDNQDAEQ